MQGNSDNTDTGEGMSHRAEMIFSAVIRYNKIQQREALKFGDTTKYAKILFRFKDLINPNFTMRELVIPWLLKGNQPEVHDNGFECSEFRLVRGNK